MVLQVATPRTPNAYTKAFGRQTNSYGSRQPPSTIAQYICDSKLTPASCWPPTKLQKEPVPCELCYATCARLRYEKHPHSSVAVSVKPRVRSLQLSFRPAKALRGDCFRFSELIGSHFKKRSHLIQDRPESHLISLIFKTFWPMSQKRRSQPPGARSKHAGAPG